MHPERRWHPGPPARRNAARRRWTGTTTSGPTWPCTGAQGLRLFVQDEGGGFADQTPGGEAAIPADVAGAWPADVEMDGDLDLVVGVASGPTAVLRNNGDGTWRLSSSSCSRRRTRARLPGRISTAMPIRTRRFSMLPATLRVLLNRQAGAFAARGRLRQAWAVGGDHSRGPRRRRGVRAAGPGQGRRRAAGPTGRGPVDVPGSGAVDRSRRARRRGVARSWRAISTTTARSICVASGRRRRAHVAGWRRPASTALADRTRRRRWSQRSTSTATACST